ncbi:hypothetical protein BDV96DRAFT_600785 [Lophiotrema nucula]|uniref:F-box domain-containing protein n=1 Tax=Lophiotrema nucula TaxID=690887 RepID=A0A6A5Z4W3_9PLEO|nr:hypothetical protein BDV96DRAFT_600785 [Lophiotrema nucula]
MSLEHTSVAPQVYHTEAQNRGVVLLYIERLPNELLIAIATDLPGIAKKILAQVSSQFRPIAEHVLYESIEFFEPKHEIALLMQTLTSRPELGHRIRYLRYNIDSTSPYPVQLSLCPKGLSEDMTQNIPPITVSMSQAQILGTILRLTPKLKSLDLQMMENDESSNLEEPVLVNDIMVEILGQVALDKTFDLSQIPGLHSIEILSINAREIPWTICSLPQLRKLLIPGVERTLSSATGRMSNVTSIELCARTNVLRTSSEASKSMASWLRSFPKLKKLYINNAFDPQFDDEWEADLEAAAYDLNLLRNTFSYSTLISALLPAFATLRDLWFIPQMDANLEFLDCLNPIGDLKCFNALKSIILPQEAFLNRSDARERTISGLITMKNLPASLEELSILCVDWSIFPWLESLLAHLRLFPRLKLIELVCYRERGSGYREMKWWWPLFWVTRALHRQGVDVRLCDYKGDEWPVDCDDGPAVAELSESLNYLSIKP